MISFDVCQYMKQQREMSVISIFNKYYEDDQEVLVEEQLAVETLVVVLMNIDSEGIKEYDETVCALKRMGSYSYTPKKLDLDLKNHPTTPTKPSIEEPSILELKEILIDLRYVFLESENTLLVIIVVDLV